MMLVRNLFRRRWWWTTLLVLVAVGVMIRLGLWQLERLEQRRAFNARVSAQLAQSPFMLTADTLTNDLTGMEYRAVVVTGEYDHSQEVVLRNQVWDYRPGFHILTPLVIAGTDQAVLVNRGWIPVEDGTPESWSKYAEPGVVQVRGMIRASRSQPDFGGVADPPPVAGETLHAWNNVNVARIDQQVSYPLLPIYIQQAPDPAWNRLPYRDLPTLELSEGSHLGYAIQWFLFAVILALGYPMYVRHHTEQKMFHAVHHKGASYHEQSHVFYSHSTPSDHRNRH